MMWYGGGLGWLWMTILMVIFWGALIALAVYAIRVFSRSRQEDAMDILRRRLAAGEISEEDFEKTKRSLQG